MSAESTQLLRMLGSGVRPASVPGSAGAKAGNGTIEGAGFADLLKQAAQGKMNSNRPVTVDKGAGIELSDADQVALSGAADRAEAAGLRKALVYLGDRAYILDVQSRSITGKADLQSGVLTGIDGVVKASPALSGAAADPAILPVPRVDPSSLALLKHLGT